LIYTNCLGNIVMGSQGKEIYATMEMKMAKGHEGGE
jgi:hypothetical protein